MSRVRYGNGIEDIMLKQSPPREAKKMLALVVMMTRKT